MTVPPLHRLTPIDDSQKYINDNGTMDSWWGKVQFPLGGSNKPFLTPLSTSSNSISSSTTTSPQVCVDDTVDLSLEENQIEDVKYYSDLDSFIQNYRICLTSDGTVSSFLDGGDSDDSDNDEFFIFNLTPSVYRGNNDRHSLRIILPSSPFESSELTLKKVLERSVARSKVPISEILQTINRARYLVVLDKNSTLNKCSKQTYNFLKILHREVLSKRRGEELKGKKGKELVLLNIRSSKSKVGSNFNKISTTLPKYTSTCAKGNKNGNVNKRRFNLKISIPKEIKSTDNMFLSSLKRDSITYSPSSLKRYFHFKIPEGINLNDEILPLWLREYTARDKVDEILVHLMHKFELLEALEMRRLNHCITKFVSGNDNDNNTDINNKNKSNNSMLLCTAFNEVFSADSKVSGTAVKDNIDLNPSTYQSVYSLPHLQRVYRRRKKKKKKEEEEEVPRLKSTATSTPISTINSTVSTVSTVSSCSTPSTPSSSLLELGIDLHSGTTSSGDTSNNSLMTPFDRYELSQGIKSFDKNRYSNILPYEHSRVKLRYSPVNFISKKNSVSSTSVVGDTVQIHSPLIPSLNKSRYTVSSYRLADLNFRKKNMKDGTQSVTLETLNSNNNNNNKNREALNRTQILSNPTPEAVRSQQFENVLSPQPIPRVSMTLGSRSASVNSTVPTAPLMASPIAMPVPISGSLSFLNSSSTINSFNSNEVEANGVKHITDVPCATAPSSSTTVTTNTTTASTTTTTTTTGDNDDNDSNGAIYPSYAREHAQLSDYFNANYLSIPDINPDFAYIATQAPLPSTIDDFWRVVTSNNIKVIVSLNSDDELRLRKWNVYWTNNNSSGDGHMSTYKINLVDTIKDIDNLSGCTLRIFQVLKNRSALAASVSENSIPSNEAIFSLVYQLQYSKWSDSMPIDMRELLHLFQIKDRLVEAPVAYLSGLTRNPLSTASLLRISKLQSCCRNFNKGIVSDSPNSKNIPLLVHCSAGCGRTGVFITLDLLINLLTNKKTMCDNMIDVWNMEQDLIFIIVNEFRKQRLSMVQNLSQFISCYESMLQFFEIMKKRNRLETASGISLGSAPFGSEL